MSVVPKTHELKIELEYALKILQGSKSWELRKNDRDFKVNDWICFYVLKSEKVFIAKICYIFFGGKYGLDADYCIISLDSIKEI